MEMKKSNLELHNYGLKICNSCLLLLHGQNCFCLLPCPSALTKKNCPGKNIVRFRQKFCLMCLLKGWKKDFLTTDNFLDLNKNHIVKDNFDFPLDKNYFGCA